MRFVRNHYYRVERILTWVSEPSPWSLLKYVRKTFIKVPQSFSKEIPQSFSKEIPVPAHIRPEYLFLRLAGSNKHLPVGRSAQSIDRAVDRTQNVYSRIVVETAKTLYDVQEVPKEDLPLYIGKNTTKHFEEEIKGTTKRRKLRRVRVVLNKDVAS